MNFLFDHYKIQNYFGDAWNVFDFIVVLGSFIDIMMSEINDTESSKKDLLANGAPSTTKVKLKRKS